MRYDKLNNKVILITGYAGFIGFHLCKFLLENTENSLIVGVDNFNNYYDKNLKYERSKILDNISVNSKSKYVTRYLSILHKEKLSDLFLRYHPNIVIHLAAQAGVRYSLENPDSYIQNNVVGFYNILECCKNNRCLNQLIFASSSSVYGDSSIEFMNKSMEEGEDTNHPCSLYAATKKCDEILAYSYSQMYKICMKGLRFFTVYGPLGRPDMAYFRFTENLIKNNTIQLYNNGNNKRSYTYIDDVVYSIVSILTSENNKLFDIINVGKENSCDTNFLVNTISKCLINQNLVDKNFNYLEHVKFTDKQLGDATITRCDSSKLNYEYGVDTSKFASLKSGIENFVQWYKSYKISEAE